jgi:hypothetical protein
MWRDEKYKTAEVRTYGVWVRMRSRCICATNRQYKDYGGRGIDVCDRWTSYENFLVDMGLVPGKPREYSLHRIDNDKGYSPENCKWATWKEQGSNKRSFCCGIDSRDIKAASDRSGLAVITIKGRLRRGMSIEEAISYMKYDSALYESMRTKSR